MSENLPNSEGEVEFDANSVLPEFLRKLAENIDNKQLNENQLQLVGEFYTSYLFETEGSVEPSTDSDKDFKKFLAMGWYVYTRLLDGKSL